MGRVDVLTSGSSKGIVSLATDTLAPPIAKIRCPSGGHYNTGQIEYGKLSNTRKEKKHRKVERGT
jgi:hypothetical protein